MERMPISQRILDTYDDLTRRERRIADLLLENPDVLVLKSASDISAEIEVYKAAHGWCPPDSRVYNEQLSEKAWTRLLALYGKALA